MRSRALIWFAAFVLTATLLLVLRRGHPRASPVVSDAASLPTARLRAYVPANAPKAMTGATWTTNGTLYPLMVQVAEQVSASVGLKQATSVPPASAENISGFRNASQAEALRRLQQRVGSSLQVYLRNENNTPNQIKGYPLAKASSGYGDSMLRDQNTVETFLSENASLFLLDDPTRELLLADRQTDELGGTVLRFTQKYNGLPVWPAELGFHLDPSGNLDLVDCAYVSTPNELNPLPKLTPIDSEAKARDAVSGAVNATVKTPELVIYSPLDQSAKLAWRVEVSVSLEDSWWVVIDAQNGQTLASISRVMHDIVSGSGVDLLGTTRPLSVSRVGPSFYMRDESKSMFDTRTGQGVIQVEDARGTTVSNLQSYFVTSLSSNSWTNPDAVSASFNLSQTYDYYQERFRRSSYNGAGSNLNAIVRIGSYPNASWNGEHKVMHFGSTDRYAASLDVVGHEVTHGVVGSIGSQGVLFYQGQSGSLNEAFADIFGEMIAARTRGTNDWLIGSELNSVLRNMANPSALLIDGTARQYPSVMSQLIQQNDPLLDRFRGRDNGGVHLNSGIINRAYYLLAAGLKDAIGIRDAERIFYRCLTVSMRPFSQFIDARLGCVAAAEALFGVGSQKALKTAEAFDAVELYAAPASTFQPANVNPVVAAPDSLLFVRKELEQQWVWDFWPLVGHWVVTGYHHSLGRRESAKGDPVNGRMLITSVKAAQPAVTGDGARSFTVGIDDGLATIQTDGVGFTNIPSLAGKVHSIAVSPQGRFVAVVFNASPGIPTNKIIILDILSNLTSTVNLVTPVADGPPLNNISHADALTFSPDGKLLIYDALSKTLGADGQFRRAWSIFGLDMETLQQQVVIPTTPEFIIGNPCFGRTSSRYIVFDAKYTNGVSAVVTLDLYAGALGVIGLSYDGFGYPVFNGDDSRVLFADSDLPTSSGRSIYSQELSSDKLGTSGNRVLEIADAQIASVYRRGAFPDVNTAPSVTLASPSQGSTFDTPATVTVSALASDIDGNVSRVEFYSNERLLRVDTSSPYGFIWTNLTSGNYTVYARVYDDQGASATSPPLRFTVRPPGRARVVNTAGTSGFEFALRLPEAGLYRLEASTNLVDWTSLGSFYSSTNLGYRDGSMTNYQRRFYRGVLTP